jgi:hypothetical protein
VGIQKLRNASGHVLSASVTGQELMAAEGREVIAGAAERNGRAASDILRG